MNQPEDRYLQRNRALAFASRAHRKQLRKGTEEGKVRAEDLDDADKLLGASVPYVMHPVPHQTLVPALSTSSKAMR
jgi:hypothetical protein